MLQPVEVCWAVAEDRAPSHSTSLSLSLSVVFKLVWLNPDEHRLLVNLCPSYCFSASVWLLSGRFQTLAWLNNCHLSEDRLHPSFTAFSDFSACVGSRRCKIFFFFFFKCCICHNGDYVYISWAQSIKGHDAAMRWCRCRHVKHVGLMPLLELSAHTLVYETLWEPPGNSSELKCIPDQSLTKIRRLHAGIKCPVWPNLQLKWFQLHV